MPLPLIPLLLGGASLITGSYGVKKGVDATSNFSKANAIGKNAKARHENYVKALEDEKEQTNKIFQNLGKLKVDIFTQQIKFLVDEIKKRKNSKSSIKGFEQLVDELDLPRMERMVLHGLSIERGLASGAMSGTLVGLGAYGSVGMFASASTGTAIASLSGVAAKNATLAWLGGGALSAGGLGMAGGTAVLGGLVAGPAIAVTGLVMASKAEEALTNARAYESKVDQAIAQINSMKLVLKGLQANAKEMETVLRKLTTAFERCKADVENDSPDAFEKLFAIGKSLKQVLDTPILEHDGSAVKNLKSKLSIASAGFLEYGN